MNQCLHHEGHEARIDNNEKNIQDLWKGLNEMKRWIIGGMGSTIIAMAVFIANILWGKH